MKQKDKDSHGAFAVTGSVDTVYTRCKKRSLWQRFKDFMERICK